MLCIYFPLAYDGLEWSKHIKLAHLISSTISPSPVKTSEAQRPNLGAFRERRHVRPLLGEPKSTRGGTWWHCDIE